MTDASSGVDDIGWIKISDSQIYKHIKNKDDVENDEVGGQGPNLFPNHAKRFLGLAAFDVADVIIRRECWCWLRNLIGYLLFDTVTFNVQTQEFDGYIGVRLEPDFENLVMDCLARRWESM